MAVKFIYLPATDIGAMRRFYTDLVGLDEIYFAENGAVAYDCDGLQFTILAAPDAQSPGAGWATQPGWSGGTVSAISWSVELSEHPFRRAVERLRSANIESVNEVPAWVGYWSYPVKDPMGNTVELSWPCEANPEPASWS